MRYDVHVSVNVIPKAEENYGYNMLTFTRRFVLEGESFTDIAGQIDFIYDTIDRKAHDNANGL